ncbi:YiiX/YebB-like N1pC/P60 family cysteine hydrolase [Bradyrhizobium sp. 25ACV]
MKKLNDENLKVGDIILTSGPNRMSRKVRKWTNSDISHAMIYVATCSVIDSTGEGVHSTNTQRLFFDDESTVVALRYRGTFTTEILTRITDYARAATGTEYSMVEAAAVVTGKFTAKTRRQFCSRLAAQAYAAGGIKLVADADYCSPEDLRNSAEMTEVQDILLPATEGEKAHWEGRLDIPQLIAECTNNFLAAARKKNKNIHALNDVHDHIMRHPEDDRHFRKVLEASGYLTVWQKEVAKNLWHYEIDLMRHLGATTASAHEHVAWYCRTTHANAGEGRRYEINSAGYATMTKMTGSETLRLLAELYETLDRLHKQRVRVALRWLEENPSADA